MKKLQNDEALLSEIAAELGIDRGRGGTERDADLPTYLEKVIEQFDSVPRYQKEYNSFVSAMSYAREDERIGYAEAVALFKKISTCFTV